MILCSTPTQIITPILIQRVFLRLNRTTQIAIAKLGRFAPWNLVHVVSQKAPLIVSTSDEVHDTLLLQKGLVMAFFSAQVTISPNVCASLDTVQTPVAFAHSVLSRHGFLINHWVLGSYLIQPLNLKHLCLNDCFNGMMSPNLYIGNGCLTKHPL